MSGQVAAEAVVQEVAWALGHLSQAYSTGGQPEWSAMRVFKSEVINWSFTPSESPS